jgi:cytochrome c551/c552
MPWGGRWWMTTAAPLLTAALCATLERALAEDPARAFRLAEDKGCFECHAIGWKLVGPAFTDVAARYRLDPEARDVLVDKVRFGGKRHWGERFNMWPQANLSDEETYILVDWVLSLH